MATWRTSLRTGSPSCSRRTHRKCHGRQPALTWPPRARASQRPSLRRDGLLARASKRWEMRRGRAGGGGAHARSGGTTSAGQAGESCWSRKQEVEHAWGQPSVRRRGPCFYVWKGFPPWFLFLVRCADERVCGQPNRRRCQGRRCQGRLLKADFRWSQPECS